MTSFRSNKELVAEWRSLSISSLILESFSIYVDYNTDNSNSLQALIGVSNSDSGYRNSYASIFIRDNGELGA